MAGPVGAQTEDAVVRRILADPRFRAAQTHLEGDHDRLVREIIDLTEIPAPPFKEDRRASAYLEMLRQLGLDHVEMDAEGNVMGIRPGTGRGSLLAVAAHLDTVFPEQTDVRVRREGTRLLAPGIGDDTRALAVLLAVLRAMNAAQIRTGSDILFLGTVGEEGLGDLRGAKYLFQQGRYKDRIAMFISIDGTGSEVLTIGALGSQRYRVTFRGPGGHSYGAFGLVNPAFALAGAVSRLSRLQVPKSPKTTFNVGVIGGGTSVNAIPSESWMDIDLRSESPAELDTLVETTLLLMQDAASEENRTRSTEQGRIKLAIQKIGDRPSGQNPETAAIVRLAGACLRAYGLEPRYHTGSTDANIPISMGIPAITIGSGGQGGRSHALDEWIDVEKTSSVRGIQIVMTILLALAELR
ncbi:MAG: M20/M25/M40 family metallo-hydrolase [Acidobacteria bacterium]|nr:M20/M25/M40 family metallo-hydrolase [Acidobacteriota bacterium]